MSERKIDNSPELAWIEEHLGDVVLVAGERFNGLKLMLRQGPTWVGLARVLRDYHAHQLISKPAEAPAPSQPTEALVDICPKCGFIMTARGCWLRCPSCDFKLKELPQAAQTVASPTIAQVALKYFPISVNRDGDDNRAVRAICRKAIRDYAATLEARVAAQKNIIATLGEGKAAAEERAEKAEARVWELGDSLVEIQKHRDAWRGYAYGKREKPQDFLDGNMADRPQTQVDALAVSLRDVGTAVSSEIKWHKEHLGRSGRGEAWESGFLAGLQQAEGLIRTFKEMPK